MITPNNPLHKAKTPLKTSIRTQDQPAKPSEEAKLILNSIIKQFALYEMRLHWKLAPNNIDQFKQQNNASIQRYIKYKTEELNNFLPYIDKALINIKKFHPELVNQNSHNLLPWKPCMDMQQAKEWSVRSKYKKILHHSTSCTAKDSLLSKGFMDVYGESGAIAFFTPSRSILNNILYARPASQKTVENEVVFALLNIPHTLMGLETLKNHIPDDLENMGNHFPLFWNVKNEYRMKARKIVQCAIFAQLGIDAVSVSYRGRLDGEIMVVNPKCITIVKEPHQLDYKLNFPENTNMLCTSITLKDYIKSTPVKK